MSSSIPLAIVLIVALLAAFFFIHSLLRKVPYTDTVPREQYKWPVWNWYPLVVISALVLALAANVFWTRSAENDSPTGGPDLAQMAEDQPDMVVDRVMVAGKEAPKVATKNTAGNMTTSTSGKKSR